MDKTFNAVAKETIAFVFRRQYRTDDAIRLGLKALFEKKLKRELEGYFFTLLGKVLKGQKRTMADLDGFKYCRQHTTPVKGARVLVKFHEKNLEFTIQI